LLFSGFASEKLRLPGLFVLPNLILHSFYTYDFPYIHNWNDALNLAHGLIFHFAHARCAVPGLKVQSEVQKSNAYLHRHSFRNMPGGLIHSFFLLRKRARNHHSGIHIKASTKFLLAYFPN
jgi:hypothetical protein